jgi:hypothetical protein
VIQPSLDNLYTSISGYDRYFKQLQQCYTNQAQAGKAVQSPDEKLGRVHNSYLAFHIKFVEYCAAREALFLQIETAVAGANVKLMGLLRILNDVDEIVLGDLADKPEADFAVGEEAAVSEPWPEEEEKDQTEHPFRVKLDETLISGMIAFES